MYKKIPGFYFEPIHQKSQRRKRETTVKGYSEVKTQMPLGFGRIYVIHLNNGKCFYLRTLLHVIKGQASFASLRIVQRVTDDTFQGICKVISVLEDDF